MEFAELVKKFAAAAASGNGDALADLFTPDGTYDDYFFGPSQGREAIKKMLAHFAEGGSNFRWDFFDPVQAGTVGYASYRFSFDSRRPEAKGARVTFAQFTCHDLCTNSFGQTQQPERVGDCGAIFADAFSQLLLGVPVFFLQSIERFGHLNRVQIFALDVFDDR